MRRGVVGLSMRSSKAICNDSPQDPSYPTVSFTASSEGGGGSGSSGGGGGGDWGANQFDNQLYGLATPRHSVAVAPASGTPSAEEVRLTAQAAAGARTDFPRCRQGSALGSLRLDSSWAGFSWVSGEPLREIGEEVGKMAGREKSEQTVVF